MLFGQTYTFVTTLWSHMSTQSGPIDLRIHLQNLIGPIYDREDQIRVHTCVIQVNVITFIKEASA
jgi:hypothetical protein